MRVKKPLLSTIIFAGILLAGIIALYVLTSRALQTDTDTIDNNAVHYITEAEVNV
ncbi:hypothetical protein [Nonlabens sp. MB-3u-79]|jgi:hypothetical protein|uniref:hypothetical protein n=1 Tax=Nonlabens sp. MB-3u-79 TaxID=2058134 RepID=UPI0012FD421D|nr:hypothetical protein [Nonlabens sp. MB-3u-79]